MRVGWAVDKHVTELVGCSGLGLQYDLITALTRPMLGGDFGAEPVENRSMVRLDPTSTASVLPPYCLRGLSAVERARDFHLKMSCQKVTR